MRGQDLPDPPFPPHYFDEAVDEEELNQRELDKEEYWEGQRLDKELGAGK
jgi:hypothetical protein